MVVAKALLAVACRRLALAPGRQVPDALSLTLRGPSESKLSIGHSGGTPRHEMAAGGGLRVDFQDYDDGNQGFAISVSPNVITISGCSGFERQVRPVNKVPVRFSSTQSPTGTRGGRLS